MKTYEITFTLVIDSERDAEAIARKIADVAQDHIWFDGDEEIWVESVETVANYDVRDPDWMKPDPEWAEDGGLNREGDPAFNGAFNKW